MRQGKQLRSDSPGGEIHRVVERGCDKLSRVGANLVRDGDIIMMHSFSTSLMGIFAGP